MKGNTNWMFNKKHGNGKKGYYKGIYCDSTWELAFLVYCFDNNIPIIRIPYDVEWTYEDLFLEKTRFLLTPENENEYYSSRMEVN